VAEPKEAKAAKPLAKLDAEEEKTRATDGYARRDVTWGGGMITAPGVSTVTTTGSLPVYTYPPHEPPGTVLMPPLPENRELAQELMSQAWRSAAYAMQATSSPHPHLVMRDIARTMLRDLLEAKGLLVHAVLDD
jgi:hypothetical protein